MRISLFVTCMCDTFLPPVGVAVTRILRSLGHEVDFPANQACCGQPAWNTGHPEHARLVARTTLKALAGAECVVCPSGSCTAMVRHSWPRLFEGEPDHDDVVGLSGRVHEFSELLVDVLGVRSLPARFEGTVAWHPSCHQYRALGVRSQPLALLDMVEGLRRVDYPSAHDCCGFGGTFAVKQATVSGRMVAEKVRHINESGADVLVGGDAGCLVNIGGSLQRHGSSIRVMHLAELLAEGWRVAL